MTTSVNVQNRHSFATFNSAVDHPDFLEIQLKSFKEFFQLETNPEDRQTEGLFKVFSENFPISDQRGQFVLEFLDYFVDPPKYSIEECMERGLSYQVPLKAKLRLYCTDEEHEDFETTEQSVFLGNIPYMTPKGSFVINGAERVIVSQLHRSPGVFFSQSFHSNGTKLYSARIIPFKGSWIEFTTDINHVLYAYIDRKKKLPVTTLLRAVGYETDRQILDLFGLADEVKVTKTGIKKLLGRRLAARVLKTWVEDIVDEETGELLSIERNEILIDRDTVVEDEHLELILESGNKTIICHKEDASSNEYSMIFNTLNKDQSNSEKEAVEYIYRQMRSSEPPDLDTARSAIDKLFFSETRYDLGEVGRYRINKRLGLDQSNSARTLTKEDIVLILKYLIELQNSKTDVDDIDHLSNRRVRTVGEQLYAEFAKGLTRMARTIRDKMNVRDNEVFTPSDLINAKTLSSVVNAFFTQNQLSQFMDQTNPLSEVTHKRRMSALGPGGLTRERAGFEVRDVHYTHYGRLCTIETPEGPNIGLISSLCVFAKVNDMGFIETPYREVKEGVVNTSEVRYLTAEEEDEKTIAQANAPTDDKGNFLNETVKARMEGDFPIVPPTKLEFMDVAPNQIASIAASLIPFLEHDDANRALMGSNMMRQSVPLLQPQSPIVGTGLEKSVARDSRVLINAEGPGEVIYVDANKITIEYTRTEQEELVSFRSNVKSYDLTKFKRTNQGTCINLRPIVKKGDKVLKDMVLCEGYATQLGELAIGRNLKVAFMPWKGYNFEDAIVISEKVVRDDIFTSIHISEHALEVKDISRGKEEFTRELPNVSEEATADLDDYGLIRIGAKVEPGDVIIGKITPKGESDPTPEEKLLRAIFGDKAGDAKDASLRAKGSNRGVVIKKQLFKKANRGDKDAKKLVQPQLDKLKKQYETDVAELKQTLVAKLKTILTGNNSAGVFNKYGVEMIKKGVKFSDKALSGIVYAEVNPKDWTKNEESNAMVRTAIHNYNIRNADMLGTYNRSKFQLEVGDDLPQNTNQLAKVYVAQKRKLKVGDKMAGRHGNKGIVAKIVREEDMPFLEDGTPVDIVLNPLGVPSRMNLGQIYETVLGWAGEKLGLKFATPIFDGATLDQINEFSDKAGIPRYGRTYLYDGGTGERFDQPATVGIIYMIKLSHMVDDKMHARSIGPYSLITQQPLGGKAQEGGQRFGEMEVWALEAFGAANILREILTIKSDDVMGRAKAYEAIVKGDVIPEPGLPESFNVLLHELRGLGLSITLD